MSRLGLERHLLDDAPAQWAASFVRTLAEGREVPAYGSPAWAALEDYRLQVASAVRAGEAWRRDGLFVDQALTDELAHLRYRQDLLDAAEFVEIAHRVHDLARFPSHAELVQRRRAA